MADLEITELLQAATRGQADAVDRVFPLVYDKLKAMATRHLRHERPDHTLSATALVHEAFLRLVASASLGWESQAQFYGIAARAMRRILVDHARRRTAAKRSRQHQVTLDTETPASDEGEADEVMAVDAALEGLARKDPRAARLVELRYFAGMTIEEAARVLGISSATAKRDWTLARAWLQRALS